MAHWQLRHPNIQPLLGVFCEDGKSPKVILPVMEHLNGKRNDISRESFVKFVSLISTDERLDLNYLSVVFV